MLVPDDLAAWANARLNVSAVTTAVTGGFWNGRPDEGATAPYGVFLLKRGDTEYTSGFEMPHYTLNLAVAVDQTAATQAQGVEQTVAAALPLVPSGATAMIRNGAGTVIHCEPRECAADVAFPLRGKSDVVTCRLAYDVWCQAASTGV